MRVKSKEEIDHLVMDNYKFAANVAKGYKGHGLEFEDLLQEALKGFVIAAERFNEEKGVKFISYAVYWARAMIIRAVCKTNCRVHVASSHKYRMTKLVQATAEWKTLNGDTEPPVEWLAKKLKCSVTSIANAYRRGDHSVVSVHDTMAGEDGDGTIENKVMAAVWALADENGSPEDIMSKNDDISRLVSLIDKLPDDERIAVRAKFFDNKTLVEIAAIIGRQSAAGAKSVTDRGLRHLKELMAT